MKPEHVALLRCPRCRTTLAYVGTTSRGRLHAGYLRCSAPGSAHRWAVQDGLPRLAEPVPRASLAGLLHLTYELFAPFHDIGVRYCLPLIMLASEEDLREHIVARMELEGLSAERRVGRPLRILDVGVGSGGGLPHVVFHLPADVEVELWGVDYSAGMLAQCARRLRTWDGPPVHLLLGDAHALPFADATFDRVLHVGGINAYRDPAAALREMARVARPGTPIVVGDEQLDERAARCCYQWLAFHAITVFDGIRRAPVEHVPIRSADLRVTQASPFYYCMSFRVPDET